MADLPDGEAAKEGDSINKFVIYQRGPVSGNAVAGRESGKKFVATDQGRRWNIFQGDTCEIFIGEIGGGAGIEVGGKTKLFFNYGASGQSDAHSRETFVYDPKSTKTAYYNCGSTSSFQKWNAPAPGAPIVELTVKDKDAPR
jgi:hypothetical protein